MLTTKDGPLWIVVLTVGTGAAFGAILRWTLSYLLNGRWALIPLGTLSANLLGGWLIGLALGWLAAHPSLPATVRLFVITGFLGGLTTFSTFSAENLAMLMRGDIGASALHMIMHVAGSFLACWLGMQMYRHFFG